jgi:hypothetical protein
MAINLLPEPTTGAPTGLNDYNYQNALQQALHGLNEYNNILTEWETAAEPEIAVGSRMVHDGGLYECQTADEAIAGAPADGYVYIKLTEAAGVLTADFVTSDAGYTFDPIKGGWYHADGTQLLPYVLLKYDSSYWKKTKFLPHQMGESADLATAAQVYPFAVMGTIYQDDQLDALPLPADLTYFPFGNQNAEDSDGNAPVFRGGGVSWLPYTDANTKHSNRGFFHFNAGFLGYSFSFGNEQVIALRIKPNFNYHNPYDIYIFNINNFSGSADNAGLLMYQSSTDKFFFRIQDDATHRIDISSDQFLNNASFQVWTDIYIKYSKANNNADMWINGVIMDGVANGTKTLTGGAAAITGLNMTYTHFSIGGVCANTTGYSDYLGTNFYLSDFALDDHYVDTYYDNYDGGTVYPYVIDITKMLSGKGQNWQILQSGNAGFRQLSTDSIDFGAGQVKMKKLCIGVWNMKTGLDQTLSFTHGITFTKIISVMGYIINDAGTFLYPFPSMDWYDFSGADNFGLGVSVITSTEINLFKTKLSEFNGTTNFDDVTINRGYIWILYEV